MKSQNFETGLSVCHKLICSILRASFKKLPAKIIKYRDRKHFGQKKFLHDLDSKVHEPYEKLSEIFVDILNHHTPLKEKQIKGNHTPFMNKELSK